ncbi:MAG: NAD(P)H-dependent oxidoreductase subunit E [bacterium]
MLNQKDLDFINSLITKYNNDKTYLIEMGFDIINEYGYIPKELLEELCKKLDISYSEAYSNLSFFNEFKFKKPKKIKVNICNGISCYFNGSKELINELSEKYQENENILITTGYCFKCCAQYPVVYVNDEIILNANKDIIIKKIESYS